MRRAAAARARASMPNDARAAADARPAAHFPNDATDARTAGPRFATVWPSREEASRRWVQVDVDAATTATRRRRSGALGVGKLIAGTAGIPIRGSRGVATVARGAAAR